MQNSTSSGTVHKHGHIQIFVGRGKWVSDFQQQNFSPYKDRHIPPFKTYRL